MGRRPGGPGPGGGRPGRGFTTPSPPSPRRPILGAHHITSSPALIQLAEDGHPPASGNSSMRETWTFHSAGQLLFGPNASSQLGDVAGRLRVRRLFLVTDPQLLRAGLHDRIHVPLSES